MSAHRKYDFDLTPSKELAYLAGAILGDGSLMHSPNHKYRIVLSVADFDFATEVQKCFHKLNQIGPYPNIYSYKKRYPPHKDRYRVGCHSKPMFDLFSDLEAIFNLGDQFPEEFLRGIWDAEGCVNDRGRVSIGMTDPTTILYVEELLLQLGIPSTLHYRKARNNHKPQYHLIIHKNKNKLIFLQKIGFTINRKQQRLELAANGKISTTKPCFPYFFQGPTKSKTEWEKLVIERNNKKREAQRARKQRKRLRRKYEQMALALPSV
jgi:intein-encoded DNA endonuclease-like protein